MRLVCPRHRYKKGASNRASEAKEFIADFGKAIEQMKAQTPEVVNGFMGMFAKTMKAGALDVKQKELIVACSPNLDPTAMRV